MVKNIPAKNLVQYFIEIAHINGFKLTTIYIVKLFYILDLLEYRTHQKSLTGSTWTFQEFGPGNPEAMQAIQEAVKAGLVKSDTHGTHHAEESFDFLVPVVNSKAKFDPAEIETKLGPPAVAEIRKIFRIHGPNTKSLLHYVYEESEPMATAIPGDVLSFEPIAKGHMSSGKPMV